MCKKFALLLLTLPFLSFSIQAQKKSPGKYPSLLWEISGNGLKKPSYLFGTMHVSSKMAFHLSDSFYQALKNVDAVALELNPDVWQGQMVRLEELKLAYSNYVQGGGNDYLSENSFRLRKYDDELKSALSTEPAVVNSLLYRTYKAKEDFEEDTFLDLYIYQTGRKLGKRGTGVENYYETEKIVLQAYADMANEKKKKNIDTDGESMRDIVEKIQDAYKRGDLDLMDSLDIMIDQSAAFREKFLYLRNEIQAASMDTIMKKSALFVGVGAAHLAGPRGVIEILRKKGYRLRPIKMSDRDAVQKDAIDKLKVPVSFTTVQAEDGFYKVNVPGPLYKVAEDYSPVVRSQFADMANGCYYQVARVKTHGAFLNHDENFIKKKIDSLLYENIPGKILKKTAIQRNGYAGYDISSRTRRGDQQRYHIFITPFEVLIFKMSGKENYVAGAEAQQFFSSISLKETTGTASLFTPAQGGFSVKLPQQNLQCINNRSSDGIQRLEVEATDKTNGNAYLILKKSVHNFDFLDEDSFDLKLIEESFRSPDFFERQLERKLSSFHGYPCLDVKEKMKDSSLVTARYIIQGPHYYAIAIRSEKHAEADAFIQSFAFTPYNYSKNTAFSDTFMHFSVNTSETPLIDTGYRAALEKVSADMAAKSNSNMYWPKDRNAVFRSETTGEMISVSVQPYPKYYYVKDSSQFWTRQLEKILDGNSMAIASKQYIEKSNGVKGYTMQLSDTGSSRIINKTLLLKDNYLFEFNVLLDSFRTKSAFVESFVNSFAPEEKKLGRSIFINCVDSFLNNLFSSDSATQAFAQQNVNNINFQQDDVPNMIAAINRLSPASKNYYDTKVKLIMELGYIKDSTKPMVVDQLMQLYQRTADTSMFQNEVVNALARHKTTKSTAAFKELLMQDPPVFDNNYGYQSMFNHFDDSLKLAVSLFPELLQLTTLDDYKSPVIGLLVSLVDSGLLQPSAYESWFNKILFDAKIELKKQRANDEKKMGEENSKTDEDDRGYDRYSYDDDDDNSTLEQYGILLMPFYDKNSNVPKFYEKLLQSRSDAIQLNTAILLLRNKKQVADSILVNLASKDKQRGKLYTALEKIQRTDKFPAAYKTQTELARSYLVENKEYSKIDSMVLVAKQTTSYQSKKGTVYFFKYRVKKEDDWKMGISGLQPENESDVNSDDALCIMTDKKLKEDKSADEQFQEQLKKILFGMHDSARNFFESDNGYSGFRQMNYDN